MNKKGAIERIAYCLVVSEEEAEQLLAMKLLNASKISGTTVMLAMNMYDIIYDIIREYNLT